MKCSSLLAILFLLPVGVQAQPVEVTVKRIRADYEAADRELPRLHAVHRDLSGTSAEGGELVGYFTRANVLRKMTATLYGETGKRVEEIYLLPEGRVFVLHTRFFYDKPFGKVARTTAQRFYFSKDRLVRWLDGDKPQPLTSDPAQKAVRERQAERQKYIHLLTQPAPDAPSA